MKKHVIASVLGAVGLVGMAVSSHGQGTIIWNTYNATPYHPIVYSSTAGGGLANTGAGQNVDAELFYSIAGGAFAPVQDGLGGTTTAIQAVTAIKQPDNGVGAPISGWIQGPIVSIPGFSGGAVTFEIEAWVASGFGAGGGTFATSLFNGTSIWTEPTAVAAAGSPAVNFGAGPTGDIVLNPVPEPTTLALAGLGGLASLLAMRRKNA